MLVVLYNAEKLFCNSSEELKRLQNECRCEFGRSCHEHVFAKVDIWHICSAAVARQQPSGCFSPTYIYATGYLILDFMIHHLFFHYFI